MYVSACWPPSTLVDIVIYHQTHVEHSSCRNLIEELFALPSPNYYQSTHCNVTNRATLYLLTITVGKPGPENLWPHQETQKGKSQQPSTSPPPRPPLPWHPPTHRCKASRHAHLTRCNQRSAATLNQTPRYCLRRLIGKPSKLLLHRFRKCG